MINISPRMFRKLFYGKLFVIGLSERGRSDPHVMFTILQKEEENDNEDLVLFKHENRPLSFVVSANWMEELRNLFDEAIRWCNNSGETSPDIYLGENLGWVFNK